MNATGFAARHRAFIPRLATESFLLRGTLTFLLATTLYSSPAQSQGARQVLVGVVRNEAGAPIESAIVTLDGQQSNSARVRTDATGRFRLADVEKGRHNIVVIAFGYAPQERDIVVDDSTGEIIVVMQVLPTQIPRVVVRGKQSGVMGKVVARVDFKPVQGVTVEVLTTRVKSVSDSIGNFEMLKDMPPGRYVLFVKHPKLQSRMMSVTVPKDSAVEVLLLVDPLSAPGGNRMAGPLAEFNQRSRWMGARSVLVPGVELAGRERLSLADALRYSPSFLRKGLLLHEAITCLYIDGLPQPNMSPYDIPASNIEAVEVFGLRSDYTGTADLHWPSGFPCGNPAATKPRGFVAGGTAAMKTGLQAKDISSKRTRWDDYGRVVFVWLKKQ